MPAPRHPSSRPIDTVVSELRVALQQYTSGAYWAEDFYNRAEELIMPLSKMNADKDTPMTKELLSAYQSYKKAIMNTKQQDKKKLTDTFAAKIQAAIANHESELGWQFTEKESTPTQITRTNSTSSTSTSSASSAQSPSDKQTPHKHKRRRWWRKWKPTDND